MSTIGKNIVVVALGVVVALTGVGTANADQHSFVHGLIQMNLLDTDADASVQSAAVGVGNAICGELDAGKDVPDVVLDMTKYHSMSDASGWVVVAVNELCPRYQGQLG